MSDEFIAKEALNMLKNVNSEILICNEIVTNENMIINTNNPERILSQNNSSVPKNDPIEESDDLQSNISKKRSVSLDF